MTSISNAQHKAFLELLHKELALAGLTADNPVMRDTGLQQSLDELLTLYEDYTACLLRIQTLIRQYEHRKKEARIQLRKLLALSKNKTFRGGKLFNNTIGKAS
ncbi:hypothetical protein [Taibaiella chishuiensis]|uniref:Uncharacterized protein n=1 Tax=Taibaiella chishuiensis TaxID=1434707 RepID=A0A2P8DDH8_9BACT|nr:hypothetical protein [Taibaiella chishuiensis]PSK95268.1 hypothetical protein B0I18_1011434 [Taibaiella chishuiensis]